MAKQTINIGASPNDGTGTPLRTAFDYTNQNFTELYTATGPSGNNIVVPGSATITGDLTVDTSTLKVDSANNRVGILTASPAYPLQVAGRISYAGAIGEGADTTVSSSGTSLLFGNSATWSDTQFFAGGNLQYRIQSAGVFTWLDGAGGTRMTLNSTGLGVQVSPSAPLCVKTRNSDQVGLRVLQSTGGTAGIQFTDDPVTADWGSILATSTSLILRSNSTLLFQTGGATTRATIDTSGNLILQSSSTPATLGTNGMLTVNATSNTNLRFSYRGSDGVTRVANITLA